MAFSADAEAKRDDAVDAAVRSYVTAGDHRDLPAFGRILHDDFRVVFTAGGAGDVSVMTKSDYLGLIRAKKIGGVDRRVELEWSRSSGNIAFAKAKLSSDGAKFDALYTLIRKDGRWLIIQDAVRFDAG